ncbi:MAG: heme ABC exporter ATP-binding protein CcmA [Paracoccaceae bacterium]
MLRARGLAVARGGVTVIEGVGIDLRAGTALILRGPNGVGKTSLLRVLAGLAEPVAGTVEADAPPVYASHADGVKPQLTVAENLTFWARLHGGSVPEDVYATFDLNGLRDRPCATLSAGQRRRAGLARLGVVGVGAALLLDEPTVSLDAASVRLFADWLTGTHLARGGAALIATHVELGLDAPVLDLSEHVAAPATADDDPFL